MKTKILCLLLAALFVFSLTACGDTSTDTTEDTTVDKTVKDTGKDTAKDTTKDTAKDTTKDATKDTTKDTAKQEGELTVTGEKYVYGNRNIVLFDAVNETDTNYTVTVTVSYLDEEGADIGGEVQTFSGFAAGCQKYFLFNPGMAFADYTYTVETQAYSGECYMKNVKSEFSDVEIHKRASKKKELLLAHWRMSNTGSKDLYAAYTFIIIAENGEVVFYDDKQDLSRIGAGTRDDITARVIQEGALGTLTIPEELQGDIRGISILREISDTMKIVSP